MFVLPGTRFNNYKPLTDLILQLVGNIFYDLYHTGFEVQGERYFCSVVGQKGRL